MSLALLAALALQASADFRIEPEPVGTVVGALLPDVVLPRIDDAAPFQLSTLRGKRVLLLQFASW